MSILVKIGTAKYQAKGDGPIPAGYVEFIGKIVLDPDDAGGTDTLMVWDGALNNIREMTTTEKLPIAQSNKIDRLKKVGTRKLQAVYPFVRDPSFLMFAEDMYSHIKPNARKPLEGRLLQLKQVRDFYEIKRAEINALATIAEVDAYDLQSGW